MHGFHLLNTSTFYTLPWHRPASPALTNCHPTVSSHCGLGQPSRTPYGCTSHCLTSFLASHCSGAVMASPPCLVLYPPLAVRCIRMCIPVTTKEIRSAQWNASEFNLSLTALICVYLWNWPLSLSHKGRDHAKPDHCYIEDSVHRGW